MSEQTAVATRPDYSIMEDVIAKGDLAKLSPERRAAYYVKVCTSVGINPLTRPLDYITLNGKLTLYFARGAADQLRKIHSVNITSMDVTYPEDMVSVLVKGQTPDGRTDVEIGVVSLSGLKGDARANAVMKAITKAKRRLTLSMVGLGWLDESEVETIPTAQAVTVTDTGEIVDSAQETAGKDSNAPVQKGKDPDAEPNWTKVRDWLIASWDIPAELAASIVRVWEHDGLTRQATLDKARVLGEDYKLNPEQVTAAVALAASKLTA